MNSSTSAPEAPTATRKYGITEPAKAFLLDLLDTPSPSAFEQAAGDAWMEYASGFAATVRRDAVGNCFAHVNPGAGPVVAVVGHLDEIGLIITKRDEGGTLRFDTIGGWDPIVLIGQHVRIVTRSGDIVRGTIGRGAVHQLDATEKSKAPEIKQMWIDVAADAAPDDAPAVEVGDYGVVDISPRIVHETRIVGRALDDRLGAFMALEIARVLNGVCDVEVVAVGSTREEIGIGGALGAAYQLAPNAAIVLEVTASSDTPAGHPLQTLELGKGPLITRGASLSEQVVDAMIDVAETRGLPHQLRGMGIRTRTDADHMVRAGQGVPVGLINVGGRYLHSPCEQADLEDVAWAVELVAAAISDTGGFARSVE